MKVNVKKGIDSRAIISKDAIIGKNVSIGPNAIIGENVVLGDNCSIGANAIVERNCTLGKNVQLFSYAVIGSDPQDLKYNNEETFLEIGDDTLIREFVTVNRGTSQNIKTVIGKRCLLLAYSHVAHDCVLGDDVILSNNATLAGHCKVGNNVVLSGFSIYHQFTRIGDYSFVQGGAAVNKDIPPFAMVGAMPLRYAGLNIEKLKRLNFKKSDVAAIKTTYKIIYGSGLIMEKVKKIESEFGSNKYCKMIVDFVLKSDRGIILLNKK